MKSFSCSTFFQAATGSYFNSSLLKLFNTHKTNSGKYIISKFIWQVYTHLNRRNQEVINVLLKKKKQKQMKIKLEFIIKISEECRQRNKIRIFHFFVTKT